ncbi:ankyrin repeat domain-containing protein [Methylophaga sp. OBS1]|uniref:ankyrin repeat domain-containing protein n=1 Tax=Methylophaga sp. OBS1 TaxID=2991933 RepID=UPI00225377C0|nr:ankyrin repeat domain-containing protein [Methylophaga sp. OBS1]MCX4191488.1 ankyrin repeat domain-containing protein [Methylophaga sp. OBS1]MCX4191567.1 ankyrin repeat domain-containing protein [Methylophaga sp. OBS1]
MTLNEVFSPEVSRFVDAVIDNDYQRADKLLKAGVDINAVGKEGITPLFWLISEEHANDLTAIEFMLKNGADPNYQDPEREVSAMWLASGGNKPEFLKLLIRYGGDVNQIGRRDESMLMVASGQGRLENIQILLDNGADMTWSNRFGETAASMCLTPGRFDLTVFFLEQGFDGDLQTLAAYVEGAMANAEMQPYKEKAIDILREKGAEFPASGRLKRHLAKHPATEAEIEGMIYGRVMY